MGVSRHKAPPEVASAVVKLLMKYVIEHDASALSALGLSSAECSALAQLRPIQIDALTSESDWIDFSVSAQKLQGVISKSIDREIEIDSIIRYIGKGAPKAMIFATMGIDNAIWNKAIAQCKMLSIATAHLTRGRPCSPSGRAIATVKSNGLNRSSNMRDYLTASSASGVSLGELWNASGQHT